VLVDQGDFFKLLDAVFSGKPGAAMDQLEELFEQEDLILLFFSLVNQFRLLVQARSLVDQGANAEAVSAKLKVSSGRAYHLVRQSKSFPAGQLDVIYKRLLELDELVKSGEIEAELAMETFVASLSAQAA
jgi:DNA polymerase-3 subunit delta